MAENDDHHVTTTKLDEKNSSDDQQLVAAAQRNIPPPPSLQNPLSTVNTTENPVWLHLYKYTLLTSGSPLNDKHINLAQTLLRKQFPKLSAL